MKVLLLKRKKYDYKYDFFYTGQHTPKSLFIEQSSCYKIIDSHLQMEYDTGVRILVLVIKYAVFIVKI